MNLEKKTSVSVWKHACMWQTRLKAHNGVNRRGFIQCVRVAMHYYSESSSTSGATVRLLTHGVRKRGRAQSSSPRPLPSGLLAVNFMTYLRFEITCLASYVCLLCRSNLIPKMPFKMNFLTGTCAEAEEIICEQTYITEFSIFWRFQRL